MSRSSSTANRPPINRVLRAHGWHHSVDAFVDVLKAELVLSYPGWSIEELLLHPSDARQFCAAVRQRTHLALPHDSILSCAFARRKVRSGMQQPSSNGKAYPNPDAELARAGFNGGARKLAPVLRTCLCAINAAWSFETLCFYPDQAERFCALVRQRTSSSPSDDLILHVAARARRRGELKTVH